MTLSRRAFGGLVSGGIVAGSGCLGFILGNEAQEFSASPATAGDASLDETGYEQANDEETSKQEVSRTFSAAGQEREVVATNYMSEYERSVSFLGMEQQAAVFVAFSTPKVDLFGKTFNPIDDMSNRELIQQVQGRYEGMEVGQEEGTTQIDTLGETVELSKFPGQADLDGTSVDVYIHIGQVSHDGDFVVPIAVYPQEIDDREEQNVVSLVEGLEH
ncbi:DUF6517 family protein [Halostella litorea]|uniref:DUF6517 family protein n=1 Tax=Halostella litorea TaxID=2528831 RepID=UPI0010920DD8|nr:DUF6517 family protein [Halostella litorea]